jgi:hypothetical protein
MLRRDRLLRHKRYGLNSFKQKLVADDASSLPASDPLNASAACRTIEGQTLDKPLRLPPEMSSDGSPDERQKRC